MTNAPLEEAESYLGDGDGIISIDDGAWCHNPEFMDTSAEEWESFLSDLSSAKTALKTPTYHLAISKERFERALKSVPSAEAYREAVEQFAELKVCASSYVSNAMACVRRNYKQTIDGGKLAEGTLRRTTLPSAIAAIRKATQLGVELNGEMEELKKVQQSLSSIK